MTIFTPKVEPNRRRTDFAARAICAPRHTLLFPLLLLLFLAGVAPRALAQDTIMEVRQEAQNALQAGAYEQAIVYLEELVSRLKGSHERDTQIMLEGIHYNLGLCYFLSGQFAKTEQQFRRYVRLYPRNRNVIPAEVFTADSLRYREQFDKAIREYERILDKRSLNADWRTDVLSSLIRCHLAQDDWETAIPCSNGPTAQPPTGGDQAGRPLC